MQTIVQLHFRTTLVIGMNLKIIEIRYICLLLFAGLVLYQLVHHCVLESLAVHGRVLAYYYLGAGSYRWDEPWTPHHNDILYLGVTFIRFSDKPSANRPLHDCDDSVIATHVSSQLTVGVTSGAYIVAWLAFKEIVWNTAAQIFNLADQFFRRVIWRNEMGGEALDEAWQKTVLHTRL